METDNLPEKDTNSKTSLFQLVGLMVVVFAMGLGAGYFIFARPLEAKLANVNQALADAQVEANKQAAAAAAAAQQGQQPQGPVKRYDVPIDDDPIYGPDTAKITIIEFSDYECPFCQKWVAEVLPRIREKYGDQVRIVYRDFPLIGLHDNAAPAAEAANCASDQGKYWEYHDLLFSGNPLGRSTFESYAQTLGMNMNEFKACLDDRRYQKEVEADYNYASELGVQSTPTFFINGLALVGAQPFEVFEQVIDMELAGEIP